MSIKTTRRDCTDESSHYPNEIHNNIIHQTELHGWEHFIYQMSSDGK